MFSVSLDRRDAETLYPAIVNYNGTVSWLSPTVFMSTCTLNMRYFPWDKQECELVVGSWTHDAGSLALNKYGDGADIRCAVIVFCTKLPSANENDILFECFYELGFASSAWQYISGER